MLAKSKISAHKVRELACNEIARIRKIRDNEDYVKIQEARIRMPKRYAKILWLIPIAVLDIQYSEEEVIKFLDDEYDNKSGLWKIYRLNGWRSDYMYAGDGVAELKRIIRLCDLAEQLPRTSGMVMIDLTEQGAQLITGPLTKEG